MYRRIPALGLLALALALGGWLDSTAQASKDAPRQYYGSWRKHDRHNYHYRHYYHKPRADYSGYKYHYAIYYPSRPDHYYFYNPHKKQFWGRCPVKHEDGKGTYSLLEEADRKESLEDIDEKKFPKPGAMPKIPDAADDALLDLPPDDVPDAAPVLKGGKQ